MEKKGSQRTLRRQDPKSNHPDIAPATLVSGFYRFYELCDSYNRKLSTDGQEATLLSYTDAGGRVNYEPSYTS